MLWGEMFNSTFYFHLLLLYTAQAAGREKCRRERGKCTNTSPPREPHTLSISVVLNSTSKQGHYCLRYIL